MQQEAFSQRLTGRRGPGYLDSRTAAAVMAASAAISTLRRAVEAGELGDASCALIMLDLDSFKLANDVFGHAYGDQVIVHVAEALKESFPGDVVCRPLRSPKGSL